MLLLTFKPPATEIPVNPSKGNKLLKVISENTLAIYLFHVMVLESLENGYFGFAINRNTFNPIIEVPLITVIVLFVSLAAILLLKKVPYLKKVIGLLSFTSNFKARTAFFVYYGNFYIQTFS